MTSDQSNDTTGTPPVDTTTGNDQPTTSSSSPNASDWDPNLAFRPNLDNFIYIEPPQFPFALFLPPTYTKLLAPLKSVPTYSPRHQYSMKLPEGLHRRLISLSTDEDLTALEPVEVDFSSASLPLSFLNNNKNNQEFSHSCNMTRILTSTVQPLGLTCHPALIALLMHPSERKQVTLNLAHPNLLAAVKINTEKGITLLSAYATDHCTPMSKPGRRFSIEGQTRDSWSVRRGQSNSVPTDQSSRHTEAQLSDPSSSSNDKRQDLEAASKTSASQTINSNSPSPSARQQQLDGDRGQHEGSTTPPVELIAYTTEDGTLKYEEDDKQGIRDSVEKGPRIVTVQVHRSATSNYQRQKLGAANKTSSIDSNPSYASEQRPSDRRPNPVSKASVEVVDELSVSQRMEATSNIATERFGDSDNAAERVPLLKRSK